MVRALSYPASMVRSLLLPFLLFTHTCVTLGQSNVGNEHGRIELLNAVVAGVGEAEAHPEERRRDHQQRDEDSPTGHGSNSNSSFLRPGRLTRSAASAGVSQARWRRSASGHWRSSRVTSSEKTKTLYLYPRLL